MKRLSKTEIKQLQSWQRKMIITFVLAMLTIVTAVSTKLIMGLPPALEYLFGAIFMVLAAVGGYLQFSAKCPNCGARIGFQSRLILPARCSKCKISFR